MFSSNFYGTFSLLLVTMDYAMRRTFQFWGWSKTKWPTGSHFGFLTHHISSGKKWKRWFMRLAIKQLTGDCWPCWSMHSSECLLVSCVVGHTG